jgi:hypothetical protein
MNQWMSGATQAKQGTFHRDHRRRRQISMELSTPVRRMISPRMHTRRAIKAPAAMNEHTQTNQQPSKADLQQDSSLHSKGKK